MVAMKLLTRHLQLFSVYRTFTWFEDKDVSGEP